MQKGDSAKLKLLLAGISARLTKNRDFFVQADCTLVSGKKKFDAKLSRADEDYTLHFQGWLCSLLHRGCNDRIADLGS